MDKKTIKQAAILYSKVASSYDKVTVGKALWKQVVMASLMFARGVIIQCKDNLDKVQRIEYGVYRYLLVVAGFTAVEALRGEIGASLVDDKTDGGYYYVSKGWTTM